MKSKQYSSPRTQLQTWTLANPVAQSMNIVHGSGGKDPFNNPGQVV